MTFISASLNVQHAATKKRCPKIQLSNAGVELAVLKFNLVVITQITRKRRIMTNDNSPAIEGINDGGN